MPLKLTKVRKQFVHMFWLVWKEHHSVNLFICSMSKSLYYAEGVHSFDKFVVFVDVVVGSIMSLSHPQCHRSIWHGSDSPRQIHTTQCVLHTWQKTGYKQNSKHTVYLSRIQLPRWPPSTHISTNTTLLSYSMSHKLPSKLMPNTKSEGLRSYMSYIDEMFGV